MCAAVYGIYGLTQEAAHVAVARENERLRAENAKQRESLNKLSSRVEAVEDASRRIAVMSGVMASTEDESNQTETDSHQTNLRGAGGPGLPLDAIRVAAAVEHKTRALERNLQAYEAVLRARQMMPSLWPVAGNLTDGFGGRSDPFGGDTAEFHAGQDIAAEWGTPVVAAANGRVSFAGWQSGYGQVVIVDHGAGLTTRYGHLSEITVQAGDEINRGAALGRIGSTGRSTGPHLHYEVRIEDRPVNPLQYLPRADR
jgi:murein DD-endopeptidase MepM/ murein hydrolase activator NlpD